MGEASTKQTAITKTASNADQEFGLDQRAVAIPLKTALQNPNGCIKYHSLLPTTIPPKDRV